MEIAYSTSTVWTPTYHDSDARSSDMENCVLKINRPDGLPPGPDVRSLI